MSIYTDLSAIQSELKAPKNRKNTFGGYSYRSAEDILEAAKPVCAKHKCVLMVSDDMVLVSDRVYVKSTAILRNEGGEEVHTTAFAREANQKKGMDDSQITGTASSYARKYALNGLFCIDDTKDADTDENEKERQSRAKKEQIETERNEAAERLAARAQCQKAVKLYCQLNNADENEAWQIIADSIGKPSKEFTKDDWQKGQRIVEAWGK